MPGSVHARIQPKLKVQAARDDHEMQADRLAEAVMMMASPAPDGIRSRIAGNPKGVDAEEVLVRQLEATKRSGGPLPAGVRAYMEPRFGVDFGDVRVHTGSEAAQMNEALRAQAFAHGAHVYFSAGKAPGNDVLTAHELTHVIQQGNADRRHVVQTSPDEGVATAEDEAEAPEDETETIITEGAEALETGGGRAKFHYAFAELEGNGIFVLFDEFAVHRLFRYLLGHYFGSREFDESREVGRGSVPPPWVGEFRAKALNVRKPQKPNPYAPKAYASERENPNYEKDKRLADLAVKLADSVASETPAQKVRRQMIEEIDKRIGTTVMSQQAINDERKKQGGEGYTPANFTTCIEFFSQVTRAVTNQSDASSPLLLGPNAYSEINPISTEKNPTVPLPPGAWHPCSATTRPKPGDLLIFSFSANEYDKETKALTHGKGEFAHISILRSIEPVSDTSGGTGTGSAREKFISVDGGGTTANEVVRYFSPDTCQIQGPGTLVRTLKGWIDVEKAAEAQLLKKQ
jgi:hypothetical protein